MGGVGTPPESKSFGMGLPDSPRLAVHVLLPKRAALVPVRLRPQQHMNTSLVPQPWVHALLLHDGRPRTHAYLLFIEEPEVVQRLPGNFGFQGDQGNPIYLHHAFGAKVTLERLWVN